MTQIEAFVSHRLCGRELRAGWLLVTLVVGAYLLLTVIDRGWHPHDEGVLGQSAERVLNGEVPHRDFDEIYTGLLTYLHAATFHVLGVKSVHLRVPLAMATLAWLVCCFQLLLRFLPPAASSASVIVLLLWAVPNYPAPMPSWYNLFLATAGTLAIVKWSESRGTKWLVLAGLLGGISFLVKLSGLFFVAGAGLGILAALRGSDTNSSGLRHPGWYPLVVAIFASGSIGVLASTVGPTAEELTRFLVPISLIVLAVAHVALRRGLRRKAPGLDEIVRATAPFVVGVTIPVLLAIWWAAANGALGSAIEGVLVIPFRRTGFAAHPPPSPTQLVAALPLIWALWPRGAVSRRSAWVTGAFLGVVTIVVLYLAVLDQRLYQGVWAVAWSLPMVVALGGVLLILRYDRPVGTPQTGRRDAVVSMVCIATFGVLVEFPFAAPIYSLYVLPLSGLALIGLVRLGRRTPPFLQLITLGIFLVFGLIHLRPGNTRSLGVAYYVAERTVPLDLPRGGIRVSPREAAGYTSLAETLQMLGKDRLLWAGPDAPEAYFLSGLPNSTRTMFDFLDRQPIWGDSLMEHLRRMNISLVALKMHRAFSPAPSEAIVAGLHEEFRNTVSIYGWSLFWR